MFARDPYNFFHAESWLMSPFLFDVLMVMLELIKMRDISVLSSNVNCQNWNYSLYVNENCKEKYVNLRCVLSKECLKIV